MIRDCRVLLEAWSIGLQNSNGIWDVGRRREVVLLVNLIGFLSVEFGRYKRREERGERREERGERREERG